MLFPEIQTIPKFIRKFKIVNDTPKISWATITQVEELGETVSQQITEAQAAIPAAISAIQHNSLLGIAENDHHNKSHGNTHDGSGSDPLQLPIELKKDGTTVISA